MKPSSYCQLGYPHDFGNPSFSLCFSELNHQLRRLFLRNRRKTSPYPWGCWWRTSKRNPCPARVAILPRGQRPKHGHMSHMKHGSYMGPKQMVDTVVFSAFLLFFPKEMFDSYQNEVWIRYPWKRNKVCWKVPDLKMAFLHTKYVSIYPLFYSIVVNIPLSFWWSLNHDACLSNHWAILVDH